MLEDNFQRNQIRTLFPSVQGPLGTLGTQGRTELELRQLGRAYQKEPSSDLQCLVTGGQDPTFKIQAAHPTAQPSLICPENGGPSR